MLASAAAPNPNAATDPFTHGVASGEPTTSSLAIWTRLTTGAATAELRWEVTEVTPLGPAECGTARRGTVVVGADRDHTATVIVDFINQAT